VFSPNERSFLKLIDGKKSITKIGKGFRVSKPGVYALITLNGMGKKINLFGKPQISFMNPRILRSRLLVIDWRETCFVLGHLIHTCQVGEKELNNFYIVQGYI